MRINSANVVKEIEESPEESQQELTLLHALSKHSVSGLKDLKKEFDPTPIDPKAKKPDLINELLPSIPKESINAIIDKAFNPKIRYTAYIASFEADLPDGEEIAKKTEGFNSDHQYQNEDLLTNGHVERSTLEYVHTIKGESIFVFSSYRKELKFDPEARESTPSTSVKKIRISVDNSTKLITMYTGNKDILGDVLRAMYYIFGKSVKTVSINLAGIVPVDTQEFSYQTVKVLDYIYHGLTELGKLGVINSIELDTPLKSKKPQLVKVKGDDLLTDEVICKYLFIHKRDLVGIRTDFTIILNGFEYLISVELGLKDDKIKVSIKKDHYSLDQLDIFFKLIEENVSIHMANRGLINAQDLHLILSRLSNLALK
ncbi:hypothetical protein C0Q44_16070 [Paenibacillus sp. PCH8]|uniref:hypothetical protein n=1 Tax=Paenibacillus sp. PCH8 TaxID=2066524 RepID=UPI000CFA6634|nr:hypothetical protein [Paenibacillus sp. PCH8]PQP82886.1 hypothetical protein C0Q44_16070 [Paenibacillus sp. PCH8]